jgi:hypothetical protein
MSKLRLSNKHNKTTGYTLVSKSDYTHLNQFNWNVSNKGYIYAYVDKKLWFLHRYICHTRKKKDITGIVVDHINSNKLDNTRQNLRCVNITDNNINRTKAKGCSSKYIGTYWNIEKQKWKAGITVNEKQIFLGYFNDQVTAAKARDRATKKYFGKIGKLNFPVKK